MCLLYKKGEPSLLKNWRPIALANCIYKLWTGVVTRLVSDDSEERGVFHGAQEGFRRKKSTSRQLEQMMMALEDAHLSGQELHVLYIDFEDAFVSPDHGRLVEVLQFLGYSQDVVRIVADLYPGDGNDPMKVKVRTDFGETE
jgi:hypothetical protein